MRLTADWDIRFVAICSKESKFYWMVSVQVRGERVHISVSQWVNLHLLLFLAYLAADFRFTLQSITDDRYKGPVVHLRSIFPQLYSIDGFHSGVIKLQSQNSEVLRILIYTRLKINTSFQPRSMFRLAFSWCFPYYCFRFTLCFFPVSIKHGLRIADHGLRTGYKTRTRSKMRTMDWV